MDLKKKTKNKKGLAWAWHYDVTLLKGRSK